MKNHHRWTTGDEETVRQLYVEGVPIIEIAYRMNMREKQIYARLSKLRSQGKLPPPRPPGIEWTEQECATLIRLWNEGSSTRRIAEILGRHSSCVSSKAAKLRMRSPSSGDVPLPRIKTRRSQLGAWDIIRLVCGYFDVSLEDITGPRRFDRLTKPRHIAAALCYAFTGRSLPSIGAVLGGRDHTTILHSIRVAPQKYPKAMAALEREIVRLIEEKANAREKANRWGSPAFGCAPRAGESSAGVGELSEVANGG